MITVSLKIGLVLKDVIKPLAKSVLIQLELTEAASATNAGIHKKILGWSCYHSSSSVSHKPTTFIISNYNMKDFI